MNKDGKDHPNMNFENDLSTRAVVLYGMAPMDNINPLNPINPKEQQEFIEKLKESVSDRIPNPFYIKPEVKQENEIEIEINSLKLMLGSISASKNNKGLLKFYLVSAQIILDKLLKHFGVSHKDIEAVKQLQEDK